VKSYFDPVILELSRQQMYSYNAEELIRSWIKFAAYWTNPDVEEWTGSPTDLLTDMASYDPLRGVTKDWTQYKMAKSLTALAKQGGAVTFAGNAGREFTIKRTLL
jgi:hypothetical protein